MLTVWFLSDENTPQWFTGVNPFATIVQCKCCQSGQLFSLTTTWPLLSHRFKSCWVISPLSLLLALVAMVNRNQIHEPFVRSPCRPRVFAQHSNAVSHSQLGPRRMAEFSTALDACQLSVSLRCTVLGGAGLWSCGPARPELAWSGLTSSSLFPCGRAGKGVVVVVLALLQIT